MSLLSTIVSDISFLEVCAALITVGLVERAMLRFAPNTWLVATGISA